MKSQSIEVEFYWERKTDIYLIIICVKWDHSKSTPIPQLQRPRL